MENLFSYGTLQQDNVQLKNFGRLLEGKKDTISGFILKDIEIKDEFVLKTSKQRFHPIISFTGNKEDRISGTVFSISAKELEEADSYEVDDYTRIEVTLDSGIKSWAYAHQE